MKPIKAIVFGLALLSINAPGQNKSRKNKVIEVSLSEKHWDFKSDAVAFLEYKGKPAMRLLTSNDKVVLKDFTFTDGTIEFDLEPQDRNFATLYFRWNSSKENECFYLRTARAGDLQAIDAIQYAPTIDGVNLWDMLFHFQTNADFRKDEWNHIKLVIAGKQMRVFVNDMDTPVLKVPHLEGNAVAGTLAFEGQAVISSLVVKPNVTEGLDPEPGIDPTDGDTRYLRDWQVSRAISMAPKIDFHDDYYPDSTTSWEPITAERRGLINLTRRFGKGEGRKIAWLKTTISSTKDQETRLHLGFSDEVWVFINGRILYIDKNYYANPIMKKPDGRCTIENTSFSIPLKKGENELLIGIGNFFYGWGIVARFDNLVDLTLKN